MGLIQGAKHGIEDVRDATPTEVRDKAREAAGAATREAIDVGQAEPELFEPEYASE